MSRHYKKGYWRNKLFTKEHREKIVKTRHTSFLKRSGIEESEWMYWPRFRDYKRGSKQRGIKFSLTMKEFIEFWQKPCHYCGDIPATIGIDRVDNTRGYELGNIVPCCSLCNYMKRDFTVDIFLEHCRKVSNNQLITK